MNIEQIFTEICNGYSEICLDKIYYLKHSNFINQSKISRLYQSYLEEGVSLGLKRESVIISELITSGKWPSYKEKTLNSILDGIKNLESTKRNIKDRIQINPLYDSIKEEEERYSKLRAERNSLIIESAEDYANDAVRPHELSDLLFLDTDIKTKAFTQEDISYLDQNFYNDLLIKYYQSLQNFSMENIESICINRNFSRMFSVCEDVYSLFGKPIVQLTNLQVSLAERSKIFTNILSECGVIPDEFSTIPDKVVMWYYLKKNDGVVTESEIKEEEDKLRRLIKR